jgi:hypothetical protein
LFHALSVFDEEPQGKQMMMVFHLDELIPAEQGDAAAVEDLAARHARLIRQRVDLLTGGGP